MLICIFVLDAQETSVQKTKQRPTKSAAFGGRLLRLCWGLRYRCFLGIQNKTWTSKIKHFKEKKWFLTNLSIHLRPRSAIYVRISEHISETYSLPGFHPVEPSSNKNMHIKWFLSSEHGYLFARANNRVPDSFSSDDMLSQECSHGLYWPISFYR